MSTYRPPRLSLRLVCLCCALINNHEENPAGRYDTFPVKLSHGQDDHFAVTMLSQHKTGKTDSMHEKATSLYTPPTHLSIVKMEEDGGGEYPTPNLTGPHLGDWIQSFYNRHVTCATKIMALEGLTFIGWP